MAMLQFSPNVVAAEEACVLVDVSTTLRLFGGARKLRRRMLDTVQAMGFSAAVGSAPTAQGGWLLARAGGGTALTMISLQRQLTHLPLNLLPTARPFAEWFDGLGCRTLEDLRRLPRAGLQRRCGADMLEALDRAYGERRKCSSGPKHRLLSIPRWTCLASRMPNRRLPTSAACWCRWLDG